MKKVLFLISVFITFSSALFNTFGQSFSVTGPSAITVPFGSETATATFYFTYYNSDGLVCPGLIYRVDNGDQVPSPACNVHSKYASRTIALTPGDHEIRFMFISLSEDPEIPWNIHQVTFCNVRVYHKVRVENNFEGGNIYVDNLSTPKTSPYDRSSFPDQSFQIGAIDQSAGDYNRIWNTNGTNNSNWAKQLAGQSAGHYSYNRNTSYTVQSSDVNTKLIAGLKKACNFTFQTTGTNIPNTNGTITITGGSSGTSPVTNPVIEGNSITASYPLNFWYNNILYTRTGGASQTVTPYSHGTYSKTYSGRPEWPSSTPRNLVIGKYLYGDGHYYNRLQWNEHPNSNVTSYKICRSVLGVGASVIGTVSRGTTSFVDYDYYWRGSGDGSLQISYSVDAYYSTEQSYSNIYYQVAYGEEIPPESKFVGNEIVRITEYSLSNYPNPFNPTTRIEYQLPKAGEVTIKVYNSLGKEVATLVNERLEEGKYTTEFNGSDLSSGMYFYVLRANEKTIVNKMLLIK